MCLRRLILSVSVFVCLSSVSFSQTSDWAVVKQLVAGQQVKVKTTDGKSHVGNVDSVNEDAIRIGKSQPIPKQNVEEIQLRSPGHHWKNAVIGTGVGAAVGLGLGLASGSQLPKGDTWDSPGQEVGIGMSLCGAIGAGIGALLPSHGAWHEVYRIK